MRVHDPTDDAMVVAAGGCRLEGPIIDRSPTPTPGWTYYHAIVIDNGAEYCTVTVNWADGATATKSMRLVWAEDCDRVLPESMEDLEFWKPPLY